MCVNREQREVRRDSSGIPTLASTLAAPGAQSTDPCWRFGPITVETSLCGGCHHSAALCVLCLYTNKTKLLYIRGLCWQQAGNAFVLGHTLKLTHINYSYMADMLFFFSLTLPTPPASTEWFVPLDWESRVGLHARSTSKQNRRVCACVCSCVCVCCMVKTWKPLMNSFRFISIIIHCQLVQFRQVCLSSIQL